MRAFFLFLIVPTLAFSSERVSIDSNSFRVNCEVEVYGTTEVHSFGMHPESDYFLYRQQQKGNLEPLLSLGAYDLISKERDVSGSLLDGTIVFKFKSPKRLSSTEQRFFSVKVFKDGSGSMSYATMSNDNGNLSLEYARSEDYENCVTIGLE